MSILGLLMGEGHIREVGDESHLFYGKREGNFYWKTRLHSLFDFNRAVYDSAGLEQCWAEFCGLGWMSEYFLHSRNTRRTRVGNLKSLFSSPTFVART
jgi:hypothetical protein